MSKNHVLGLLDSMLWLVRDLRDDRRDFLVPFRAADSESDGDWVVEKAGGLNRFRECRSPELRFRVGERPAAGAEAGVVEGFTKVSRRGVEMGRVLTEGMVEVTFKE